MNTYKAADLQQIWRNNTGAYQLRFADRNYAVPQKRWLLHVAQIHAEITGNWVPAFDCDDFAFSLKLEAQKLHAESKPTIDGLAVGVVFYHQDKGGGHAINWSVTKQGKLWFIEPQTGREICLSGAELLSVFFVYA